MPFLFTSFFFFFNDTATTEIYTLSLHDALPICPGWAATSSSWATPRSSGWWAPRASPAPRAGCRSEEHTSELQSQSNLVCRLLLEKKKKKTEQLAPLDIIVVKTRQRLHFRSSIP